MALAVGMGAHGTEVVDSDETPSPKTEGGSRTIRYFGDYELLEEIARGGMGVVYRARQVSLNRPVALKMILAGRLATPASMQRFQTEAESAARLDHPHIVPIYEIGEHDRQHYFSMKLIDGGTLAERIAKQPLTRPADTLSHPMGEGRGEGERSVPTFDVRHSAFVISKVARAVHYAHQRGILHRDLKPTNILIDGQGEPHVTDFGLAKLIESDAGLTHSAAVMGTPSYMAPEQAAGHVKELTTATDIYSLGAILYELLAAQPPFVAETPLEIMRKVVEEEPIPPSLVWRRHGEAAVSSKSHLAPRKSEIDKDLETICLKCLNKNPQSRYGSAEMLADDLCRWRNGEPILARPVSAAEKLWRWCKRKPTIAALLAAVLVLLVTVTAGSILAAYRLERSSKQAREAEQRAREKLWASYLDQARAARWSGRAGRRFKSLEAITKAAEIQPSLELRNEAIAALALVDIRVIKTRRNPDPKRELPAWDAAMERYAIATPGKDIVLRRASDDGELARLPDIGSAAACAYPFSPDGAWLPVLYSDGGLKLWNLARAEPLFSVPNILSTVSIDFHPDGRRVTVAQPSTNLPIYSLADGAELKSFPIPYLAHCVRFDPSGKRIAIAASNRREVVVLDADSGAVQLSLLHPAGVGEVAWHPSGERLATAGKDGLLRVWDAATGGLFRPPMNGNRGELANIAYTHRGGILLSSHWAGLLLWDAETGERLVELEAYLGTIGVSADDQRVGLITWGLSHLSLCELALGRAAQSIRLPGPNFIGDVAFSPDARWLACAVPEAVYLLNSESTALLVKLPATGAASVCFSPDGETLYVTEARGLFAWPIHANLASGEVVFGPARRL
ncbi:MAG TPA: WD40 repeat domain-containing serine/threonine protein kinase, partial [Verrucomicrobiae bacterium]|nr:WD40 repeat domain-containing serine/threonine protein kinase [Verrucomicrobiae bacterium]